MSDRIPADGGKILLPLPGRRRRVVDADDVYYLEAQGDETDVRLRAPRRLRDVSSLGEVMKKLGRVGFVRVHRNHAVNPGRVREIRPASSGWEAQLEPAVNKVLPVTRGALDALLAAYRGSKASPSNSGSTGPVLAFPASTHRFTMRQNKFAPGWDEARVQRVVAHYETQTEAEAVAEDEAAFESDGRTFIEVPKELVPRVRELISKHRK